MRVRNTSMVAAMALVIGAIAAPAAATPAAASVATGHAVATTKAAAGATTKAAAAATTKAAAAATTKAAAKKKTVALTFDDGPGDYTYKVLDILKKYKIKATFCIVGGNVASYPKTTLRIVDEGHQLCNHSWSHPDLTTLSAAKVKKQLTDTEAAIKEATKKSPTVVRFPYGASNAKVRKVAKSLKLRTLGWDVDPEDWRKPPAKTITARILKATGPGDVVLMHDGGGDRSRTVASLAATIAKLKKKGYTFVLA
jgi:peptidoglycan/xylan/chitin deacetylase (PgdA/CDA1 family)